MSLILRVVFRPILYPFPSFGFARHVDLPLVHLFRLESVTCLLQHAVYSSSLHAVLVMKSEVGFLLSPKKVRVSHHAVLVQRRHAVANARHCWN